MTDIAQLNHLADTLGLRDHDHCSSITQLIRTIQQHCDEEPCFATDKRNNCAEICEWRRDCHPQKSVWLR